MREALARGQSAIASLLQSTRLPAPSGAALRAARGQAMSLRSIRGPGLPRLRDWVVRRFLPLLVNNAEEISIHDNFLASYEVLCERREIRLHTEFRDSSGPVEFTDVVFRGVVCYDFRHDSQIGTIIFDID